ncbi:MAG: iron ABC transporter permease [Bacteroidales bacterium]|nr:iron ABC transporter permease [Bacteroidales bacterium]
MDNTGKNIIIFTVLLVITSLLFLLDIFMGSVSLKITDVLKALFTTSEPEIEMIVLRFRLPKAITATVVGIALSISGLQMQTLFRNPMAGPYVLGISSGASLGVAFIILGFSADLSPENLRGMGNWSVIAAAWAGAAAVMVLMLWLSSKLKDILTVLVIGIMLAGGISAIVTIMQYFSHETMLKAYIVWTMGSLGNLTASQLNVMLLSVSAGIVISLLSVKSLNALLLGENYAATIGLNVGLSRLLILTGTSILAGSITAFCGPIGFIGIAVPHVTRLIFRSADHRILLPGIFLTGSSIMLLSDIVSQLPGSDNVLPVNSVTAMIGIPVVIWVVLRNRKYQGVL